ncbi:MAG: hypothetical protein IPM29_13675 [Planctomycetes bacterium]|nr:hypothetical protein [Planctomycetota bacterium]
MTPDPLDLQARLGELLTLATADARLVGEMARARRTFFGADQPDYVRDPAELDAAAQRFAEWYLLERPSDVLGRLPVESLDADERPQFAPLRRSRQGLFLVEASATGETGVRDLEGGERLRLLGLPRRLRPGDLVVGRVFAIEDGSDEHVVSSGAAIVAGAPRLAVAFQRDIRNLGLERRLDQAEVEQLVHRRLAAHAPARGPQVAETTAPIEHLEAQLHALLDEAGCAEQHPATAISAALRDSDAPGPVLGPLLDQFAFDTDVDLDRLRELLLQLWNAHRAAHADRAVPRALEPAPRPAARASAQPRQPRFRRRADESLGESLARRIGEGLGAHENVADLFADVERMLGEPLGDDDEPDVPAGTDDDVGLDDGNLAGMVREFAWERGASAAAESWLRRLADQQLRGPIQRVDVEEIEAADLLRYLTEAWLEAAPERRVAHLQDAYEALAGFVAWVAETQWVDLRGRLELARTALVDEADRLHRAAAAVAIADADPTGSQRALVRVIDASLDAAIRVETTAPPAGEFELVTSVPAAGFEEGDLLILGLSLGGGPPRVHGPVIALPRAAEQVLGG